MSARNKLTHFLNCKCLPACPFYKRTSCPAWQQHKKNKAEEAKKNRLLAAKRRVKLVRAKKNAPKNTAVNIQTDYLGWQHTAQAHMKATARLRQHLSELAELESPADRCDGRLTRILCWKILQLEYDLDHGPNDDEVPCPTFKKVYDICVGFGYPTRYQNGAPLLPEWKLYCPRRVKSCVKNKKNKKSAVVHWEESLCPQDYIMFFPFLRPAEPVVISGPKLDMFPPEEPLMPKPLPLFDVPDVPAPKRRNVLGWNTQKSVGPGKRTSELCGMIPRQNITERPQVRVGRTVGEALRENGGDLYLTLLPGYTRAVLENEGIPGLQSYEEALFEAAETAKYSYDGARGLSIETMKGIIKAQAERARNSSLLEASAQKHLDRCRMDALWWTYTAFFTSNYGPPKDPAAWWRDQSRLNTRQVYLQTFLGSVMFLAKNMPDLVKTVPVAGQPTRYKALARITEADFKERLTLLDLSSAPIDYHQIVQ